MLLLRVLGLLLAIGIGVCALLYAITGERRYLRYAWNAFRVGLAFGVLVLLLLFGERLLVAV